MPMIKANEELLFPALFGNQQRGSKPRCHLLTHGDRVDVATRLSALIEPWGKVRPDDKWMPAGFANCSEAQLHTADLLLPLLEHRLALRDWWLAAASGRSTTPNIDIASTCEIDGIDGLLLVEAKAHTAELRNEERGKPLAFSASENSERNHESIGHAIAEANTSLGLATQMKWTLARDSHYQMSNRFAWACKVAELGVPVILVYLGFTGCSEMQNGKQQIPFLDDTSWRSMVLEHSRSLFPDAVWEYKWTVDGTPLVPLIRSCAQELSFT